MTLGLPSLLTPYDADGLVDKKRSVSPPPRQVTLAASANSPASFGRIVGGYACGNGKSVGATRLGTLPVWLFFLSIQRHRCRRRSRMYAARRLNAAEIPDHHVGRVRRNHTHLDDSFGLAAHQRMSAQLKVHHETFFCQYGDRAARAPRRLISNGAE
jgi:hypothetical protein